MAVTNAMMQRNVRFYSNKTTALREAKRRNGIVIQEIRGRQWSVATGNKVIQESLRRSRISLSYLGKSPPRIVADFRDRGKSRL